MNGRSGDSARARWARTSSSEIKARTSSSSSISIVCSSCEVRKPSKKCTNGIRVCSVAAWATSAKSCASCTDAADKRAKPVWRTAITSEWSPKIDSPCAASERAATCITAAVSSPAILYMFGIISRRPCEAVNVVPSAPPWSAPCRAPAAPASLCISTTAGTVPHRFVCPLLDHSSANSAIGEEGVIGKMQQTSLHRCATHAAASLPSTVARISDSPPPHRRVQRKRTQDPVPAQGPSRSSAPGTVRSTPDTRCTGRSRTCTAAPDRA